MARRRKPCSLVIMAILLNAIGLGFVVVLPRAIVLGRADLPTATRKRPAVTTALIVRIARITRCPLRRRSGRLAGASNVASLLTLRPLHLCADFDTRPADRADTRELGYDLHV